jgi:hypothetical protein
MGLSTEERLDRLEDRQARSEIRQTRSEAWHLKWGRIWTVMWVGVVILMPLAFAWQLHNTFHQNCVARAEARKPVISVVELVVQQARDPDSPLVVQLRDAIQPGHVLGPIDC